jgi:uncharacterized membrane protein YeaQ/YmgE (transglycosylase-associated protein family)
VVLAPDRRVSAPGGWGQGRRDRRSSAIQPDAAAKSWQEFRRNLGPPYPDNLNKETHMDPVSLIIFLIVGALAGWLAGKLMRGGGFGLLGNILVGIVGAFLGGFLLPMIGLNFGGTVGYFVTAFLGAVILLFIVGLIKRV